MKLESFGRLVTHGGRTNEVFAEHINQYTDECSSIGDYLRQTSLPRLTVDFERDARIFSEGEVALEAFAVIDGAVRFCRDDMFGGRRILGHAKPGDLVLPFTNGSHQFSAESATAVTLMVYSLDRMDRLAAIDLRLHQQMIAHRTAHRRLATGPVGQAMNVLRRNRTLVRLGRPDPIMRTLRARRAYAAGI